MESLGGNGICTRKFLVFKMEGWTAFKLHVVYFLDCMSDCLPCLNVGFFFFFHSLYYSTCFVFFFFPDFGKLIEESECIAMKLSARLDQHNFLFFEICTI
jgi:hypothetical protein